MDKGIKITNAVIKKDGLYFAIKRGDQPCKGMYTFPVGGVEKGEKYSETVVRELF